MHTAHYNRTYNTAIAPAKYGQRGWLVAVATCLLATLTADAQSPAQATPWHGKERHLHYAPWEQHAFKLVQGKRRFNRALYGTHTGFRIEAGDVPEFAFYLPGMGGNARLALHTGTGSKWLSEADSIETLYKPGCMQYTVRDKLLGRGSITLEVWALAHAEGAMMKLSTQWVQATAQVALVYGGATAKKFSRDGDIGADPESVFYLHPDNCQDNQYTLQSNSYVLRFAKGSRQIAGILPTASSLQLVEAAPYGTGYKPPAVALKEASNPALHASFGIGGTGTYYLGWYMQPTTATYAQLPQHYAAAVAAIDTLTARVLLHTPDPWLNTLGPALAIAGDAIWESPTYLHGAIAWRMRLPAWRGANVADPLGWHQRAKTHFSSYAQSQVTTPLWAPVVMDTALGLARHLEKIGTGMFTSGYICRNPNGDIRPHHYDMNLVFIDQLLTHLDWTGDTAFLRHMWPVIQRHLAWEKRNFDSDGDGLYDAYCCIWASDALQYSGGGVTHATAYNYRAFSKAAQLATLLGHDGTAYRQEATKIYEALQAQLWLQEKGWFAEYKDLLGHQLVHPSAGLWTMYHAMDSKVADPFQAYQMMQYVATEIPRIPVSATGLPGRHHVLSTTNWMPYTWSVNNVALGEMLHTSLAYWQAGRAADAFPLWKSALVESMYLGPSPGSFHQLSFYDAIRGELYRDFADPIGMAARSLVEGLFGISPHAWADTLTIVPGYPDAWAFADLEVPDVQFHYKQAAHADTYTITQAFDQPMHLNLELRAKKTLLPVVTVNGKIAQTQFISDAVGVPKIRIVAEKAPRFEVKVSWQGRAPVRWSARQPLCTGDTFKHNFGEAQVLAIHDPQGVLHRAAIRGTAISGTIGALPGHKTFFARLQQNDAQWWLPIDLTVSKPVHLHSHTIAGDSIVLTLSTAGQALPHTIALNEGTYTIQPGSAGAAAIHWQLPLQALRTGTNTLRPLYKSEQADAPVTFTWWQPQMAPAVYEMVDMQALFNARVTDIFQQQYLSPRPIGPTLQLPVQGMGNWCYPLVTASISDSGFRAQAGSRNVYATPYGFGFATPGQVGKKNIAFVSQWDNYPAAIEIPLSGTASHAYFLMAGTTNHMQSRFENARIVVQYQDGSADTLPLVNPENWWPIEQDYYEDGYAFARATARPPRVYLHSGSISTRPLPRYSSIKGYTGMAVEGGAATMVDLPLNPGKPLKQLTLQAIANEVVAGLMGITLQRSQPTKNYQP